MVETLECPALLGADLCVPLRLELMSRVMVQLKEEADGEQDEAEEVAPVRITRAQAKIVQEKEKADEQASAQSDCTPIALAEIFDFPDSYFEGDPVVTPVDELSSLPEEGGSEIPLPDLVCDVSDSGKLVKEQQADVSLEQVLSLA